MINCIFRFNKSAHKKHKSYEKLIFKINCLLLLFLITKSKTYRWTFFLHIWDKIIINFIDFEIKFIFLRLNKIKLEIKSTLKSKLNKILFAAKFFTQSVLFSDEFFRDINN